MAIQRTVTVCATRINSAANALGSLGQASLTAMARRLAFHRPSAAKRTQASVTAHSKTGFDHNQPGQKLLSDTKVVPNKSDKLNISATVTRRPRGIKNDAMPAPAESRSANARSGRSRPSRQAATAG
jgi:hypothetical protein